MLLFTALAVVLYLVSDRTLNALEARTPPIVNSRT